MADKFVNERDLKFLLYEVFDAQDLCKYPYFEEHSRETFDMVLETALKMGRDLLFPCFREMDQMPPELIDGEVRVHPKVKEFMKACGEGGWIAANAPFERDGQQLPILVTSVCRFIFSAANYSASVYPLLTTGAAHLITSFGSEELIHTFIPRMVSGEWQGTMALTEPQAGSSLSDITTRAEPTEQGNYRIRGQKIFISAGDHDGVDNVVHLMLVRIKGAAAIAWQWLKQGIKAVEGLQGASSEEAKQFYRSKLYTLRFFFGYELPKTDGLMRSIVDADGLTVEMGAAYFT